MRVKGITFQQIILGLALLAALCWNLAQANEIKELRLESNAVSTRAVLQLQADVAYRAFALGAPDRFVVDLPGVALTRDLRMPAAAGVVKAVRSGQPAAGTLRLVFDLSVPAAQIKPLLETTPDGPRIVLEWPTLRSADMRDPATDALAQTPREPPATTSAVLASQHGAASSIAVTPPIPSPQAGTLAPARSTQSEPAIIASSAAAATSSTKLGTTKLGTPTKIGTPISASVPAEMGSATPAPGRPVPERSVPERPVPERPVPERPVPESISSGAVADAAPSSAAPIPQTSPSTSDTAVQAMGGISDKPSVVVAVEPQTPVGAGKRLQDLRVGIRPLIIAIDAGHGGQDPGAIGPTGKREKDATLAIARELARQINATPGLKAVLTRDHDVFLPLTRRPQIARAAKADMFISIHADAAENRAAKGSSVYVLSLRGASSQRARWLADKENAADLIGGGHVPKSDDMLTSVLLDLTQSGQMKASENAANHILAGLKAVGSHHKPQVERANFAVLRTSDMPAMLVETAFISNPEEEKRLNDPSHQRALARAVLDGVHAYFSRQPPPGTLYAARAKAQGESAGVLAAKGPTIITGGSP
ncbi:MAG: AMIN domain-containing protein [Lysobacteraceae bacterium]|nr:MAG: AMIN domain-containing protein [Xanthomonadaceae bacterium]